MRQGTLACLAAFVLLCLTSCSSPPHLSGYLYAFVNNEFTITDLSTGKIIAHVMGPTTVSFRYAAKIDDQTILLSGDKVWRSGPPVDVKVGNHMVRFAPGKLTSWFYNRFTGELTSYEVPSRYYGLGMPVYMPKYKSVVFYCGDKQLCRVPLGHSDAVTVIDDNSQDEGLGGSGYYLIVAVSDDEVVYATDNGTAKYYSLATGKVGYLPLGQCVPQLWRSRTQQLLCAIFQPKIHYYFIKLDGTGKARTPNFDGAPVNYLTKYDTVLVTAPQLIWNPVPYEWNMLRSYDLTSHKMYKFASGAWAGQGSVAWFSDVPKVIPGITIKSAGSTLATP